MPEGLATKFLRVVWTKQHGDGHALMATKDWSSGSWQDVPATEPLTLPTLDDLYFAPTLFSEPRRQKQFALPGRWLYADLDEVVPDSIEGRLRPTIAWETSEGRFQCLWLLRRPLRPSQFEVVNQKLTYHVGADKGGWSCTKVLRVPGSINNKREEPVDVKLLWVESTVYEAADIYNIVRSTEVGVLTPGELADFKVSKSTPERLRKRWGSKLTIEAKRLLKEPVAVGSRSEALYKLEMLLAEVGVPPAQAFVMVKNAPCNKYRGQRREDTQLWAEVNKAVDTVRRSTKASGSSRSAVARNSKSTRSRSSETSSGKNGSAGSPDGGTRRRLVRVDEFRRTKIPRTRWTVEGIWSGHAHGVIAGPPKSFKSLIALDMAISVASGSNFLNRFPVPKQGPVIMIQKENQLGDVQDMIERIEQSRGLGESYETNGAKAIRIKGSEYPLYMPTGLIDFDLTEKSDIRWLNRQIRRLKPQLVVLDPLYLMAEGVDENSAHQMTPVLQQLLNIKQNHQCGTLIIHHFKKANAENPVKSMIERISGTGVFGRWYESALLLERPDETEAFVHLVPLHRGHASNGRLDVQFDLGSEDEPTYRVQVGSPRAKAADEYRTLESMVGDNDGRVALQTVADALDISIRAAKRRAEKAGMKVQQAQNGNHRKLYIVKDPQGT